MQPTVVCQNAPTAPVNFTELLPVCIQWTNNTPAIGLAAAGTGNTFIYCQNRVQTHW
jgi:hypothetical protein